jgi:ABC-type Fe3+ transport system permease subunit
MTLAAVCAWSFLRSTLVALVAAFISKPLAKSITSWRTPIGRDDRPTARVHLARQARSLGRQFIWGLLLTPFLVPPLLVGYAYYRPALMLVHYPRTTEAVYCVVLFLRFFGAAVLIRIFAPPSPISAEAIHCQRLLRSADESWPRRFFADGLTWLRGPGHASIAAFAVIFLSAFQEFEIAALMGITAGDVQSPASWTVWLFNWQAGGPPLSESLAYAVTPLICELALIVPVLILLGSWMSSPWRIETSADSEGRSRIASCAFLIVATLLVAGGPALIVTRGALRGVQSQAASGPLLPEIGVAAAIASTTVLLTCAICAAALGAAPRNWRGWIVSLLCLPGALGALVLSLGMLWLFQLSGLQAFSQSLVPLILAVTLVLLPRSLILTAVLGSGRRPQAAHCARLLAQSPSAPQRRLAARLIDELEVRRFFWAAVLVWYWAYWELTAPSILAPPAATPFVVRMYNFMHYRQDDPLSVMIIASILVPLAAIAVLAAGRRFVVRWVLQ